MTRSVLARGGALVVGQTVLTKVLSVLSQVILGWLLVPEEFGLYAIALAVATVGRAFQDRGVRDIVIRYGPSRFAELGGPASRLAVALNLLSATLLVGAAVPIEHVLAAPGLALLLMIIGVEMCLSTPWAIYSARLASQQQFGALAGITLIGVGVQYALTVAFAIGGLGALSIVLPLPIASLARWLSGRRVLGAVGLRLRSASFGWRALLPSTLTLAAGGLALGAFQQSDNLAIGVWAGTAVVGVYFFSFQLSHQLVAVLTSALQAVLFPALSRLSGDGSRFHHAAVSALGVVVFAVALLGGMLSIGFPLLEQIVWDGRWAGAVPVVRALALGMAGRAAVEVGKTVLLSAGRYRTWLASIVVLALGIFATAGLAAATWGTAAAAGWAIAIYLTIVGMVGSAALGSLLGMQVDEAADVVRLNTEPGSTTAVARPAHPPHQPAAILRNVWAPWMVSMGWALVFIASLPADPRDLRSGAAAVLAVGAYVLLTITTVRVVAAQVLVDATTLLPRRVRTTVSQLLRLDVLEATP